MNAKDAPPLPILPLAYDIPTACAVADEGRTALYEAIADGRLKARKHGRRTSILATELREYVESWPLIEPSAARTDVALTRIKPSPVKASVETRRRQRALPPPP